jgi:hypothetical protein
LKKLILLWLQHVGRLHETSDNSDLFSDDTDGTIESSIEATSPCPSHHYTTLLPSSVSDARSTPSLPTTASSKHLTLNIQAGEEVKSVGLFKYFPTTT